ncbi:copper homeostasis protein [Flavobacterium sp. 316]|uniref:PF03932 family protein CutC n=1 Tax=Flavobacterium sediminilitoris TaxID=2024526 RepID=A0ABY4HIC8_9FLAO|nr:MULTISPECIES: copper homeostasis protein CutC [Flavobacterium]KIX22166.1 copper homeostasis protein [Flavobacterium sp. 316]UOX32485.1 copper homeostasis protein CutC [Flavobacterium sediminilitoris]
MKKIEIACFNVKSAIIASKAGADRIEFCEGYEIGGITPKIEDVKEVKNKIRTDLYVMIRPVGGKFNYTEKAFLQMKQSIQEMKLLGVDGFVFGILTPQNTIDIERNKELLELAKPLPCTFHRAFDTIEDKKTALSILITLGFTTVLTSGIITTALEGKEILKTLLQLSKNKITIMPGGGIRATNIQLLDSYINASYYHSAALKKEEEITDFDEVIQLKKNLS